MNLLRPAPGLNLPEGPFDVIAADPPWTYKQWAKHVDPGNTRAPDRHYRTQSLDWVCSLPVEFSAAKDCHLFLWITGPLLVQGTHLKVLDAWGFKPSSMAFVWVKPNRRNGQGRFFAPPMSAVDFFMGLGKTTRQNAEFVVLGRRGKPKRLSGGVRQIVVEERRQHSRKPDSFYAAVDDYAGTDVRRLDLFTRERRPGWVAWGDQVDHFTTRDVRRKAA